MWGYIWLGDLFGTMIYGGALQNKILMQKLMLSSLCDYIADTISGQAACFCTALGMAFILSAPFLLPLGRNP
ncbi:MAG: hypothetical protein QF535_12970 [Anaerolineales bacterium]|jgi:hypothetical protein|nr:hypothetical protein [Anaerolineales bacterium]